MERFDHVVQHCSGQAGINAYPENMVHYEVGVFERSDHTLWRIKISRLADKIAAEEQARSDPVAFEELHHLIARERRFGSRRDGKAEPTGLAVGCGFGQDEELLEVL